MGIDLKKMRQKLADLHNKGGNGSGADSDRDWET